MKIITNDSNENYIETAIFDEDGEVVAQFKISKKKDSIGDIYYINTLIREDVYVDGHHWLDTQLISDSKEIALLTKHRENNV